MIEMVTALMTNAVLEGTSRKPFHFPTSRVRGEGGTSYIGEDHKYDLRIHRMLRRVYRGPRCEALAVLRAL